LSSVKEFLKRRDLFPSEGRQEKKGKGIRTQKSASPNRAEGGRKKEQRGKKREESTA